MASRSRGTILDKDDIRNNIMADRSKKRKRFFKGEKPFIRQFTIDDMWILWAAYKEGSFPNLPEMQKDEFYTFIRGRLQGYQFLFLVEDNNRRFKSGRGPVCLIVANTDGWKFEPHVDYFKWATKYNIIRTTLTFLNWVSFKKEIGVCIIRSLKDTVPLFKYMREFIGITYVGTIRGGDIRGDESIFSLSGKKDNGRGKASKGLHGDSNGSGPTSASTGGDSSSTGT